MMRKRLSPLMLLLFLAASGGFVGAAAAQGAKAPPPEVEVISAAFAPVVVTRDLPGRLQVVRHVQVRARVEGVLEKRLFVEGADVRAGAPLYRINVDAYRLQLQAAEAELAAARKVLERYQPLLEKQAVTQQELEAAQLRVQLATTAVSKAQLELEYAEPRAPFSGRIGRTLVDEGALVGKAEATLLTTIEQVDPIRVEFTRPHVEWLAEQQSIANSGLPAPQEKTVQLLLEDGSVYPHPGRITYTDFAVAADSGSVMQRAEFPNPQRQLLPGAFVRVRLPTARIEAALRAPQRAVVSNAAGQSVMVVDEQGKATPRPVVVAGMIEGDFIITEGLAGGEQIIVNGLQKVRPGAMVKTTPWRPGAPLLAPPGAPQKQAAPASGPAPPAAAAPAAAANPAPAVARAAATPSAQTPSGGK